MRRRLIRLAILAYPRSFRREFAREMETSADAFLRSRGRAALPLLLADFVRSVPREWWRAIRPVAEPRPEWRSPRRQSGEPMQRLVQDVRFAFRLLARSPMFTVTAVVTLALGIGANAAFFTLADATLLRPLKVNAPGQLVAMPWSSAYPDYLEYARRTDLFSGVVASSNGRVTVTAGGTSDVGQALFLSGNAFSVLGVPAALGRPLTPADDVAPGGPVVAVLTDGYWRTRFGSDPSVIGTTIRVNGKPAMIVGVAPPTFRGVSLSSSPLMFMPLTSHATVATGFFARPEIYTTNDFAWLSVTGRLQPDVTSDQASAALDAMYRQLNPPRPGETPERLILQPLATRAVGGQDAPALRRFVLLLVGVVAVTLLIGCANLANLLLSRATSRHREVGIRVALGASRTRVFAQMLVETVVLAAIGGAAGLVVAQITLALLTSYQLPGDIPIANLASMQTRPARLDRPEIDLRRLVAGFLRMAPDVAIVGEVRDREALPLLLTLSSGVTGYTTIHAGSARQALTRLRFVAQLSNAASTLPVCESALS